MRSIIKGINFANLLPSPLEWFTIAFYRCVLSYCIFALKIATHNFSFLLIDAQLYFSLDTVFSKRRNALFFFEIAVSNVRVQFAFIVIVQVDTGIFLTRSNTVRTTSFVTVEKQRLRRLRDKSVRNRKRCDFCARIITVSSAQRH